jgi:hypothetical protein
MVSCDLGRLDMALVRSYGVPTATATTEAAAEVVVAAIRGGAARTEGHV